MHHIKLLLCRVNCNINSVKVDALTDTEYKLSSKKVTKFDSVDVETLIETLPYMVKGKKDRI